MRCHGWYHWEVFSKIFRVAVDHLEVKMGRLNAQIMAVKMKRTDQFVVVVQNILSSMRKTKMNLLRINLDLNMGTAWI